MHSPDLANLLSDLAKTVSGKDSAAEPTQNLSAITKALQRALAMPSADRGEESPAPVQATLTKTTNGAATFSSSGSARVDLFFKSKGSGLYAQEAIPEDLLDQAGSVAC